MEFKAAGCVGVLSAVLFCASLAAGLTSDRDSQITVLMTNGASVRESVLRDAEVEAARIFRDAGIAISWVNCTAGKNPFNKNCDGIPGTNEFEVHIVPNGKTKSDLVFGVAFLDEDGRGKYANIFYDRVTEAHRQLGAEISTLVGMVAAHEIGHLLLGLHAHSNAGIMTAVWRENVVNQMQTGTLWFTHQQAQRMRARIEDGRRPTLVSVSGTDGDTPSGQPGRRRYVYGRHACGVTFEGIQPWEWCGLPATEGGASQRRLR